MPGLPFQFDSIDENSVLTGFSIDENSEILTGLADQPEIDDFGHSRYFPPRVTLSSPVSDLYPVSLPNLRPVSSVQTNCSKQALMNCGEWQSIGLLPITNVLHYYCIFIW